MWFVRRCCYSKQVFASAVDKRAVGFVGFHQPAVRCRPFLLSSGGRKVQQRTKTVSPTSVALFSLSSLSSQNLSSSQRYRYYYKPNNQNRYYYTNGESFYNNHRQQHTLAILWGMAVAGAMTAMSNAAGSNQHTSRCDDDGTTTPSNKASSFPLRKHSFPLVLESSQNEDDESQQSDYYGVSDVRVAKILKDSENWNWHTLLDMNVDIKLCNNHHDDDDDAVDTRVVDDEQLQNAIYHVAQRSTFDSAEGFGVLLAHYLLKSHKFVKRVVVKVNQTNWDRANVEDIDDDHDHHGDQRLHNHGFVPLGGKESSGAKITWDRNTNNLGITSFIENLSLLKTSQNSNTKKDCNTFDTGIFPIEMNVSWNCDDMHVDHVAVRDTIRRVLLQSILGPPTTGVYSPSLEATLYDAACVVFTEIRSIQSITLSARRPVEYKGPINVPKSGGDSTVWVPTTSASTSDDVASCTVVRETPE